MLMRKEILPIAFVTFVNMLGFSILFPVLPFIVKQYNAGPAMYGLLLTAYSLFMFIGAPVLGSLSDQYGRKPLLLISHFGTLLSWVVFGVAYVLPQIMIGPVALPLLVIAISRVTDGVTGGNNSVANAYVSDITTPLERTRVFGMLGALVGLAIVVGPALGSFSSTAGIGYLGTAIAAFCISLITLVWMWKFLKESLPLSSRRDTRERMFDRINIVAKIWKQRHNKLLFSLYIVRVVFSLMMTAYTSIMVLFLIDRFHFSQRALGPFLLFIGLFLIFNQGVVVPFLSDKIGEKKMLAVGLASMASGLVLVASTNNLALFVLFQYVLNLGLSLCLPSFKGLFSKLASHRQQGEIMGLDESVMAGASAIAPLVSGYLYAGYSYHVFYLYSAITVGVLCYYVWQARGLRVEPA